MTLENWYNYHKLEEKDLPRTLARINHPELSPISFGDVGDIVTPERVAVTHVYLLPPAPPIIPTSKGEQIAWLISQDKYRGMGIWLRTLMLGYSLPPGFVESELVYQEPFARIAKATFDLAVAVYLHSEDFQFTAFCKNPATLWFLCIWHNSQRWLKNVGLTGTPQTLSKNNALKLCGDTLTQLQEYRLSYNPVPTVAEDAMAALLLEAQNLARTDATAHTHLRAFIRAVRTEMRKIRYCKEIQTGYILPSGELYSIGNGMRSHPPLGGNK